MTTLATATHVIFTPDAGDFIVQSVKFPAILERRNTDQAQFAGVGIVYGARCVTNPVGGAQYRFVPCQDNEQPEVQADQ